MNNRTYSLTQRARDMAHDVAAVGYDFETRDQSVDAGADAAVRTVLEALLSDPGLTTRESLAGLLADVDAHCAGR